MIGRAHPLLSTTACVRNASWRVFRLAASLEEEHGLRLRVSAGLGPASPTTGVTGCDHRQHSRARGRRRNRRTSRHTACGTSCASRLLQRPGSAGVAGEPAIRPNPSGQLLEDQLADPAGVGLAAHLLHHRTDQRAGRGHLAVADLLGDVGVGRDGLVDRRRQRAVVGDDRRARGRPRSRPACPRRRAARRSTCRASLSLSVPSSTSAWTRATSAGRDAQRRRARRPARWRAGPARRATTCAPPAASAPAAIGLLDQVEGAGADGVAHLEVGEAPVLLEPGPLLGGGSGSVAAQLLDPLAASARSGTRSGSGK